MQTVGSTREGCRRVRVVLVTPGFSATEEDWCIPVLRDLAETLTDHLDVSIVALRYPAESRSYRIAGIRVVAVGGGQRRGIARIGLTWHALTAVCSEARRHAADVIHAFWAHEPGAVSCLAGRVVGLPVLVTLMGGELASLPAIRYGGQLTTVNRFLTRFSLARADRVIAISRTLEAVASTMVEPSRLCHHSLGVQTDRFFPSTQKRVPESEESKIRFLFVGSLIPVKGLDVVLRAFAQCRRDAPNTRLDIVGEGPLRRSLGLLVEQLEMGETVRFLGAVGHSDLPERFRSADALVIGSWWEGMSQVALEALASGLPIVGTAVGVIPELEGAARWVPPGNVKALAQEMLAVATSNETRSQMAAAASKLARPIGGCAASLARLYEQLSGNLSHDPRHQRS